jgi:hypothetical protein
LNESNLLTDGVLQEFDHADRGRWKQERPPRGQVHAERFDRWFVLSAHAKGVGISAALSRLRKGERVSTATMRY